TGAYALESPFSPGVSGNFNTGHGYAALHNITTGFSNSVIGARAGSAITTANNTICIGANVAGENVSGRCYIGGIYGAASSGGLPVYVNFNNKLGTLTSSRQFKDDIKPMNNASEAILALKPVRFRYKSDIDPAGLLQFGLIAEDVEKVNRDLVAYDKEGNAYGVRYDQVNAMLLNEFLKEHKAFLEEQRQVAE